MSFRVNEIEQIVAKYVETQGSVAVVAWDEGNTVVYCNKAFSGLMQSEAELCGKTVFQFLRFPEYPGFDFGALDGSMKTSACLKTGPTDYRCDSVIFQLNRGYIAFCDRPVILQSDIVEKMAKMNLELTNLTWESQKKNRTIERINAQLKQEIAERQRTEEKLTASQARYQVLMEQSFEALALIDLQTQEIVEVNRKFSEMLGYSLPEDSPLYVSKLLLESTSNRDERYNLALRDKSGFPLEIIGFRHKNGTAVYAERAGTVIHIDGRDYMLASGRDITAERRRQAELAHDFELARRVQHGLLPELPVSPLVTIRTLYYHWHFVSGDAYYLAWHNEGSLLRGFLIDVSGHGLATAIQNTSINVLLREASASTLPLIEQLRQVNRRAEKYFTEGTYAAMLGFELDLSQSQLRYVGAGITQFYLNGRKIETPGMFVGMWAEAEFTAGVVPVQAGDVLYFLTDGFTDALAQQGKTEFCSPDGSDFDADVAALVRLASSGVLRDDATGVCLKITP